MICGHSMEINLVSDIFINLSLQQIKLLSAILTEFVMLVTPLIMEVTLSGMSHYYFSELFVDCFQDGIFRKPKIRSPYSRFDSVASEKGFASESVIFKGQYRDSGIEISDVKSVQSSKAQVTFQILFYIFL